jgi:hypothetical protein
MVLTPILTSTAGTTRAYNPGMAETYSWLPIEGESLGRPLYARASYITNFSDLTIQLSASDLNIGSVTLKDEATGRFADVVAIPGYGAGLQVLTQDLESSIDDVTIGDREGNLASVNPSTSSLLVDVTNASLPVSYADTPNLDAFGRLRISTPTSLFDSKSIYDSSRFFWNTRQRDAQEVFLTNDSSRLATVTADNGFFVKETYRRFAYQPGKSQLLMFTGVLSAEEDIIKRVGIFSALSGNDYFEEPVGIYFQVYKTSGMNDNESYAWVINNSTNLVPSQSAVQADWNIDKMDGTGPSGITLDFSKAQIFFTDFEWLGVGRVRCGFNVNGVNYTCHEFLNANNTAGTYIINPNLPIRAELRSTGATFGSMKTICSSIASEGGVENPAFVTRSAYLSASLNPAIGNRRGILGIRLNPLRANGAQEVIDVNIMPEITQQNVFAPYRWELVMRPTPATGRTWIDMDGGDAGNIQYAQGATNLEIVGGTTVASGFANREVTINLGKTTYDKSLRLGVDLDGVTDELWIVVTPIAQNVPLWASITVAETD